MRDLAVDDVEIALQVPKIRRQLGDSRSNRIHGIEVLQARNPVEEILRLRRRRAEFPGQICRRGGRILRGRVIGRLRLFQLVDAVGQFLGGVACAQKGRRQRNADRDNRADHRPKRAKTPQKLRKLLAKCSAGGRAIGNLNRKILDLKRQVLDIAAQPTARFGSHVSRSFSGLRQLGLRLLQPLRILRLRDRADLQRLVQIAHLALVLPGRTVNRVVFLGETIQVAHMRAHGLGIRDTALRVLKGPLGILSALAIQRDDPVSLFRKLRVRKSGGNDKVRLLRHQNPSIPMARN